MSSDLRMDWATHAAAVYACRYWHYSGCMPAGKTVKVGAWELGRFIGCVIFGRGANNNLLQPYGLTQTEGCELTRVALDAHRTPVSRIVAIAVRLLHRQSPGLRLIVSFADPEQGHHGGIYQAGGWVYAGSSHPQRELVIGGKDVHKRTANALWGTASPERLRELLGCRVDYSPVKFKHTYLLPLDPEIRDRVAPLAQPYPKRSKRAMTEHPSEQRRFDTDPNAPPITVRRATRGRPRRLRATLKRTPGAA
jgi:hypothetical protein